MTVNETVSLLERELKQTGEDLDKVLDIAEQRGISVLYHQLFLKEKGLEHEFTAFVAEKIVEQREETQDEAVKNA